MDKSINVEWRRVRDTRYFVSENGDVKGPSGRILKQKSKKEGYLFVTICLGAGVLKYEHTSRLVCAAFHGPAPSDTCHADHMNRNRKDNRAANLRWLEAAQNRALRVYQSGETNWNAKLTADQIREIRKSQSRRTDLAARYGISIRYINDIKRRVVWKHLTD